MSGLFNDVQAGSVSGDAPAASSLRLQTTSRGRPVTLLYGTNRVSPNFIWAGDFTATPVFQTTPSAGKGGRGGTTSASWRYTAALAMSLAIGQVTDVRRAWIGKNRYDSFTAVAEAMNCVLFDGTPWADQAEWPWMRTTHPSESLYYNKIAYLGTPRYDLGNEPYVTNHSFEVCGKGASSTVLDAEPGLIVNDFLLDKFYGASFPEAAYSREATRVWNNYCKGVGLKTSPVYTDQISAAEALARLLTATNSTCVYSQGRLRIKPYGDTPVGFYEPVTTPVYDFTDADYLTTQDAPVRVTRKSIADAYNTVSIKYYNRDNEYNEEVAEAKDQASIELYGVKAMDPIDVAEIVDPASARTLAQLILQRVMYVRATYEFTVGWRYGLLEPMDLVTITDSALGLVKKVVRITEISESEDDELTIRAEEYITGNASATLYPSSSGTGYTMPRNTQAPPVVEPAFFTRRSGDLLRIGVATTSNDELWGGCVIWVSQDGSTYRRFGEAKGRARYGTLTAPISETADTLSVALAGLGGVIDSVSSLDADEYLSKIYVGTEVMAYQDAELTALKTYTLAGLRRGGLTTAATAHAAGEVVIVADAALVEGPNLSQDSIGKKFYFKFTSYNIFGGGSELLEDVQVYTYTIPSAAFTDELPDIKGLTSVYRDARTLLVWQPIADASANGLDYEVRKGAAWERAEIIGRVTVPELVLAGDGQYLVKARLAKAYSSTAASIVVEGAVLPTNVIAAYDEQASGWQGAKENTAVSDTFLVLSSGDLFSTIPLVSEVPSVAYYGGAADVGTYTLPEASIIDVTTPQPCNVAVTYTIDYVSVAEAAAAGSAAAALSTSVGEYAGAGEATIEIRTAMSNDNWGPWVAYVPGVYVGRKFSLRVVLTTRNPDVITLLTSLKISVDVPDRVARGVGVACPAAGLSVVHATPFQTTPTTQITILNALAGDLCVLTNQSRLGFSVQVLNAGTPVARTINYLSQGY